MIGDHVFISASYDTGAALLRSRDDDSSSSVWSGDESLSNHYATSVHHDGLLYGFHGRQEQGPSLRCVELATRQGPLGAGGLRRGLDPARGRTSC